jgi:ADP-dependent NAD(P)H-hydrate dehydratase / NAD(P)H-hydrate epimerase
VQPVFTAAEMRALDARAIETLGIPGPRLMEHAGRGAAALIAREWTPIRGKRILVLCGKGNNGGDGFVVARHLKAKGARLRVLLAGLRGEVKGDAAQALGRWRGKVEEIRDEGDMAVVARALGEADIVVDALLGTGLTGPVRGIMAQMIERLNNSAGRAHVPVVSLDLPSGLGSDGGAVLGPTVRATVTATFAGLKRSLLVYPAAELAGRVTVVPIGVPQAEVGRGINTFLLEDADIRSLFPPRPAEAHKGSYGHLLVIAGSAGKTGAAALAGRSALRSGVGLCTVATPASQQPIVAGFSMETMTEPIAETASQSLAVKAREHLLDLAMQRDAVALGPGISLDPETQALARALVAGVPRPMIVDADALSALAGHLDLLEEAPAPRVLTPHPGEMARMLGVSIAQVQADRIETVRRFCVRYRVHLNLKGARSVLGSPDGRVFINPTGNPGMATGGSGDVLTGMIGAFLARQFEPLAALQAGCFLHGLAGDIAAADRGEEGLVAGDIIEAIPGALSPAPR